jgi:hypothetical protein
LAPYIGNRIVAGEIARAGGLAGWSPGELAPDDDERRIWRSSKPPRIALRVYLGFGREDRFAETASTHGSRAAVERLPDHRRSSRLEHLARALGVFFGVRTYEPAIAAAWKPSRFIAVSAAAHLAAGAAVLAPSRGLADGRSDYWSPITSR